MEWIMSNQYRVAIIGTGFAKIVHIPGFCNHPRFVVVSLSGRDPKRTAQLAAAFNISDWHTDWQEMLSSGSFDVVSVVTPPHLHHDIALASLESGYHVLCEKPMALNTQQAKQMLLKVQETGLTAMINHELRYLPARRKFGELLQSGYIGEPKRLVLSYYLNFRSDAKLPWDWWSDLDRGGGLLGALGSHLFDAIHHWLGPPKRIWGKLSTVISERPMPSSGEFRRVTADDTFVAVLDLENGAEVVLDITSSSKHNLGYKIMASGTEGTLIIEDGQRLVGARGDSNLQELGRFPFPSNDQEDWRFSPFQKLLDVFADGIDRGVSPSPNFTDGLAHQRFIDAVKLSNNSGRWVDFDKIEGGQGG